LPLPPASFFPTVFFFMIKPSFREKPA